MFLFRLAGYLKCTVNELEQNLSYVELLEWMDFYSVEPFGEERADMRNAQLCKMVNDLHHWLAGKESPHKTIDFMLFTDRYVRQEEEEAKEGEHKGAKIDPKLLTQLFLISARGA